MHPSVQAKLGQFLKGFEGSVKYMYLDIKGLVSVGVGRLIDPVDMAKSLRFQFKGNPGSEADGGVVAQEWAKVKEHQEWKTQGAAPFANITSLELSDAGIEKMITDLANGIEKYLTTNTSARVFYGKFNDWPADAQLGILGVAWGIMPIPQFGWHKFPAACRDEDWLAASEHCFISSPLHAGRNPAHKMLFKNAATVIATGMDISTLAWPNDISFLGWGPRAA